MSAIFRMSIPGKILSRKEGRTPHEIEYRVLLEDTTTTLVRERHEHKKMINDRYMTNIYDDAAMNTFGKKL